MVCIKAGIQCRTSEEYAKRAHKTANLVSVGSILDVNNNQISKFWFISGLEINITSRETVCHRKDGIFYSYELDCCCY